MNRRLPALEGRAATAALLALYAAAILLRMPQIVIKGRFWAEEGTVFFANAWRMHPLEAVFHPYGGYLNLLANAATVIARWSVPLEDAPYVTIAVALLCQLLPPALLLTARDAWLRPVPVRLLGLGLLLVVPVSEEIWLQSLHCQFELALGCGMILALDVPRGWRQGGSLLVLALAPLCGPGAIALSPLFVLRAAIDRSAGRVVQLLVLGGATALQFGLFFTFGADRGYTPDIRMLLAVVTVKDLIVPFMGVNTSFGYASRIAAAAAAGQVGLWVAMAPVFVFGTAAAISLRTRNFPAFWLLAGAGAVAVTAYTGGLDGAVALMNPRAGARYAFIPLSLTALSFLALASRRPTRWPAAVICVWLLTVGARAYVAPWPPTKDGPVWTAEVAKWRSDPSYTMQLWPPPWTLRLPAPQ